MHLRLPSTGNFKVLILQQNEFLKISVHLTLLLTYF